MAQRPVFAGDFAEALKFHVNLHHAAYPSIPPQGIYFEDLVERAFKRIKKPFTLIEPGGKNQPRHDLLVESYRISLKTETGESTRADRIVITKLCTTEKEPWTAKVLIERVMAHLNRYDRIIMLRAIWREPLIHYQLLEIPIALLKLIGTSNPQPVGYRKGRVSLGADVMRRGQKAFHVHFDASDGKCSIRDLPVSLCTMLLEWDVKIKD
jgi:type II restriction enzyme